MYLWMLTYKNEADWNQIDKNPTMFLKRMYSQKKKNPSCPVRECCCLQLEMTIGPNCLWTESNLRTVCSLQGEPIPQRPFQLWRRKIGEKSNWFLICVAFLCFPKWSVYCDFPDNRSSFKDLQNMHSLSPGVSDIFFLSFKEKGPFTEKTGTFSVTP